jgi:hypothetical protein
LPEESEPHPLFEEVLPKLQSLDELNNPYASTLLRVLSGYGQRFLQTSEVALNKPGNQEVVESLLDAIAAYFRAVRPDEFIADDILTICNETEACCRHADDNGDNNDRLHEVLEAVPELKAEIQAMLVLSCIGVELINPIFSKTDAIGTMMRKKIKPISDQIFIQLNTLMNK